MVLHSWLSKWLGAYMQYTWVIHGLIIFLVASFVYWLQRRLLKRLYRRFMKTANVWDDSLVQALSLPLSLFIWLVAISLFAQFLSLDWGEKAWAHEVVRVREGCAILFFIWFVWRYISQVEYRLIHPISRQQRIDTETVAVVGRVARIALTAVAFLTLLSALGIPLSGVVAFGGAGALIMGIAAQHILANWFGGLMIFWDKPFKLHEWISSPDRDIEGRVVDIGWRTTKIMAPDNRPLYIPNSVFAQTIIANTDRMTHRRIEATIGLRYDDASCLRDIVSDIEVFLRAYPSVDLEQRFVVNFIGFGQSALNIHFLCFVKELNLNRWRDIQQEIFLKVIDIVQSHGARFAYPTVTSYNYRMNNEVKI